MKKVLTLVLILGGAILIGAPQAEAAYGEGGSIFAHFYQWFRDADGDGIPNCLDEDWVRPEDGTGYQVKVGNGREEEPGMGSQKGSNTSSPEVGEQPQNRLRYEHKYRWRKELDDNGCDGTQSHDRLRDGSCGD